MGRGEFSADKLQRNAKISGVTPKMFWLEYISITSQSAWIFDSDGFIKLGLTTIPIKSV